MSGERWVGTEVSPMREMSDESNSCAGQNWFGPGRPKGGHTRRIEEGSAAQMPRMPLPPRERFRADQWLLFGCTRERRPGQHDELRGWDVPPSAPDIDVDEYARVHPPEIVRIPGSIAQHGLLPLISPADGDPLGGEEAGDDDEALTQSPYSEADDPRWEEQRLKLAEEATATYSPVGEMVASPLPSAVHALPRFLAAEAQVAAKVEEPLLRVGSFGKQIERSASSPRTPRQIVRGSSRVGPQDKKRAGQELLQPLNDMERWTEQVHMEIAPNAEGTSQSPRSLSSRSESVTAQPTETEKHEQGRPDQPAASAFVSSGEGGSPQKTASIPSDTKSNLMSPCGLQVRAMSVHVSPRLPSLNLGTGGWRSQTSVPSASDGDCDTKGLDAATQGKGAGLVDNKHDTSHQRTERLKLRRMGRKTRPESARSATGSNQNAMWVVDLADEADTNEKLRPKTARVRASAYVQTHTQHTYTSAPGPASPRSHQRFGLSGKPLRLFSPPNSPLLSFERLREYESAPILHAPRARPGTARPSGTRCAHPTTERKRPSTARPAMTEPLVPARASSKNRCPELEPSSASPYWTDPDADKQFTGKDTSKLLRPPVVQNLEDFIFTTATLFTNMKQVARSGGFPTCYYSEEQQRAIRFSAKRYIYLRVHARVCEPKLVEKTEKQRDRHKATGRE